MLLRKAACFRFTRASESHILRLLAPVQCPRAHITMNVYIAQFGYPPSIFTTRAAQRTALAAV